MCCGPFSGCYLVARVKEYTLLVSTLWWHVLMEIFCRMECYRIWKWINSFTTFCACFTRLQQRSFRLFRRKWQSWLKEGFLLAMPCTMILRFCLSSFLFVWSMNVRILCKFSFAQALLLTHPKKDLRDTSEYQPFLKYCFSSLTELGIIFAVSLILLFLFRICGPNLCDLQSRDGRRKALRHLAAEILGVEIQIGEHCPVSLAFIAWF